MTRSIHKVPPELHLTDKKEIAKYRHGKAVPIHIPSQSTGKALEDEIVTSELGKRKVKKIRHKIARKLDKKVIKKETEDLE